MSRKTSNRFKQLNVLIDEIFPLIADRPAQAALMVCYRHANELGVVDMSAGKLAEHLGLSQQKSAWKVLQKLRKIRAIIPISECNGGQKRNGSGIANKYRITFMLSGLAEEKMLEIAKALDLDRIIDEVGRRHGV
jgi:hypothetical protein